MLPPDMNLTVSRRMLDVQSPMISVVGEMVKRRPGTISLGQGVVHYGPPEGVARAVAEAAAKDPRVNRYSLTFGIDELLEGLSRKLELENGIHIGPDRHVVVTAGANMGFLNAVLAVADVGDEVILLSPFYFNYEMAVQMAGCRAAVVATDAQYQPDVRRIECAITPRTQAVVTISPNNPTGAVYSRESLEAINTMCRERGLYHIADEAYEYFVYGESRHFSPGSIEGSAAHTISLHSFSKAYGMAGWRVGFMVIPAHLEEAVKKVQDTNLICPPVLNQIAAAAALAEGHGWCEQRIAGIARVREMVLEELSKLGDRVELPTPGGAFYALLRVHTNRRDMELVETLIRDFGVAVMPGSTFGITDGCYLRVAYGALEAGTVAEGMGRLVRGLKAAV
ncbi:MAG TPA: pyridoxal phosphate-dependent aminotransferase [Tepidisphaeraceae bacterium]|nr:pyridoxal phosphate-dependent aminotransferase [Tepidisphaeraceae bacterium]